MLCDNLFLSNTVAHSSKQLKILYITAYNAKNDCLRKINFQVKHGKYHGMMAIIIRFYPWWKEDSFHSSWNISTKFITDLYTLLCIYLVVRGSKKQQRRGWDYSNFTKGKLFLVSYKTKCYLRQSHPSLPLPKKVLPLSLSLAKKRTYMDTHLKKKLSDLL